jgi:secreted Zn-dependent insulinase-like peptidase
LILLKTIEDALEDIDDFLAKMETSEFEMSKAAVMSVKQESMASMRDQAHAVWREIAEQSYHFARHEKVSDFF